MSIKFKQSRIYAKAIFDQAKDSDRLEDWSLFLNLASIVVSECAESKLLANPRIEWGEKLDLFAAAVGDFREAGNLIKVLLEHKHLNLLPEIVVYYRKLLLAYRNVLEVKMVVARELAREQKNTLLAVLKERYQKGVQLECVVDSSLLGGAILYVDGKVIDGSIKGKLQQLKKNLLLKSVYVRTRTD